MKVNIDVLIVEDEPAIARSIQMSIAAFGDTFHVIGIEYNGKDGLETIRRKKPQLVFTDIRMPMMSGLEMIEETQKTGLDIRFVILSGYSEFEYAKRAMQSGITDYLLKPIVSEEIHELLTKVKVLFETSLRASMRDYVAHVPAHPKNINELDNPFGPYDCILMFSYYGPIVNAFYGDFNIGKEAIMNLDSSFIPFLAEKYGIQLLEIKGWHYNEILYVAIISPEENVPLKKLADDLWNSIQSPETYTNLIVSERILHGRDIPQAVTECNLFTLFHLPFGRNSALHYQPFGTKKSPAVSEYVYQRCGKYSNYISLSELKVLVTDLILFWQESNITQFQMQTDLRYLLNYFLSFDSADKQYSVNVDEIISSCNSFTDLESTLIFEMEELLQIKEDTWHNAASRHTVYQVKEFLEQNYTQPLSSKVFNEKFGYNEKYITSLYKAQFGITPGKYICELRIALAKQIMRANPYILLKDVAVQTGYMDALYFSRVFKTKEGMSPSKYLQEMRGE